MAQTPATNRQIPDNAILDAFNKQNYLGNRYNYIFNGTAAGGTETSIIYLANPLTVGGNPNTVGLFVDMRKISIVTAAAMGFLNIYLNPTISAAGTVRTPGNVRSKSPSTSIATLQSSPTASANGTLIENIAALAFSPQASNLLFVLDPGTSILVTSTLTSGAVENVQLSWFEC